jgi:D-alanyl-D-alanine carboxypeptidase
LVEEGRLSLDDSVEQWLPGRVHGGRRVLVRHLLNHTSGLTGTSGHFTVMTKPGIHQSYSNLNYGLLFEILTEVTGRRLGPEVRERILIPLGLDDTGTEKTPRGSPPWLGVPEGDCRICLHEGGGMISTTADVAAFFRALTGGQLLDEETLAEMTATTPAGNAGFGLFRFDLPCGPVWGHGGDFTYYANHVIASRDGSTVVVVARNIGDWWSVKGLAEELYCDALAAA